MWRKFESIWNSSHANLDSGNVSGTVFGRSVVFDELDIGLSLDSVDARDTGREVFEAGLDLAPDFLEPGREAGFPDLYPNGISAPSFSILFKYFFSPSFSSL